MNKILIAVLGVLLLTACAKRDTSSSAKHTKSRQVSASKFH